ncbi:hypothetical protein ACI77O_12735 [Pseudomonas tritici]|uniref:hypothetical protein n=1 Tax=Pseudomonas tritici TaxID=2745518 RepID=UPI00387B840B
MSQQDEAYTIETHKHRYAMWCAARAYGRGLEGGGNDFAFALITAVGLELVKGPDHIGLDVDEWLIGLMNKMVAEAKARGHTMFVFGHAQKVVNIYMKGVLICGGHHLHPAVMRLHPPLDSKLFDGLRTHLYRERATLKAERRAFLNAQKGNRSWTSFAESDYRAHIEVIKALQVGAPLYEVERHWNLHRKSRA